MMRILLAIALALSPLPLSRRKERRRRLPTSSWPIRRRRRAHLS
jgi:hypothetical protein